MVTRGTIATGGDDDYEDDVRFDYLKDWIAEVQSNLRKERETRNKLNRDVVELMGNLTREREARAELERNLESQAELIRELKINQERETASRDQVQTALQNSKFLVFQLHLSVL